MATKYTEEEARTRWGVGCPSEATLTALLAVAWEACLAYAPVADEADIPEGHREAHFQHTRNIFSASKSGPSGDIGPEGFAFTPHPLDWHVKQLLRPRRAVPRVG